MFANLARWLRRRRSRADSPERAAPPRIVVTNSGIELNGSVYAPTSDFIAALRELDPEEVRFVGIIETTYEAMESAVGAFQRSGLRAKTGFVGNIRLDASPGTSQSGSVG